jgi:ribonuclease HI
LIQNTVKKRLLIREHVLFIREIDPDKSERILAILSDKEGSRTQQPQVTMSERLPPCTVFQSELRAIQMACKHLCLHEHNNKDIHIHVDSQAALQSLVKSQITSKTVHQTVELLRELAGRHTVTLQRVKAHVGIPGNKMAEEAAKAGSQSNRFTQMEISNSRTELKPFIRDARNFEWTRSWADREGKDCRQTRLFFPTLNPKVWKDMKAYSNLAPICLARIIRFLTGHTFMTCHEVLIQRSRGRDDLGGDNALCRLCEEDMETPE